MSFTIGKRLQITCDASIAMTIHIFKRGINAKECVCRGSRDLECAFRTQREVAIYTYFDDSKTVDAELMLYRYAIITRITRIKLHKLIYERGLCLRIDWLFGVSVGEYVLSKHVV